MEIHDILRKKWCLNKHKAWAEIFCPNLTASLRECQTYFRAKTECPISDDWDISFFAFCGRWNDPYIDMVKSYTSIPKDIDWRILSWGVLSPSLHLPLAHLLNKISPNKEMQSSSTEYNKKSQIGHASHSKPRTTSPCPTHTSFYYWNSILNSESFESAFFFFGSK